MDDTAEGRYYMILGRDLLIELGLDIKFSYHVIIGDSVSYEGCSSPTIDVHNYDFKYIVEIILYQFYMDKYFE